MRGLASSLSPSCKNSAGMSSAPHAFPRGSALTFLRTWRSLTTWPAPSSGAVSTAAASSSADSGSPVGSPPNVDLKWFTYVSTLSGSSAHPPPLWRLQAPFTMRMKPPKLEGFPSSSTALRNRSVHRWRRCALYTLALLVASKYWC